MRDNRAVWVTAMTQYAARRRHSTNIRESGRYLPRQFNSVTRERFLRSRRRRYLDRISITPTDAQTATIHSLATLEWGALSAEHENTLQSLREAREHRRLLLKVLADFERSLAPPAASVKAKAKPGPPQIGIEEHMARLRERRESAS